MNIVILYFIILYIQKVISIRFYNVIIYTSIRKKLGTLHPVQTFFYMYI